MDGTLESSGASGSQIHPALRQRMINRAATFSEGARTLPRRRSSIFSDISDTRNSFRSSTDDLLRSSTNDMERLATSDEPTYWHSAPLAFAILPAVGGILFKNGSSIVTDILLLGLASLFLNWCVRAPWDWYHAAQRVHTLVPEPDLIDDTTIREEDEDEDMDGSAGSLKEGRLETPPTPEAKPMIASQEAAQQELGRQEMWALAACFVGPFLGAYLLHAIRSQLTRQSEGLVSNYNLTIFVMAAELRPVSHIIKLKQARMLHLQRVVKSDLDPSDRITKTEGQDLSTRLADIEARLVDGSGNGSNGNIDSKANEIGLTIRQGMQPQLDALNRAVRRYEKRTAAQQMQIEARFADLENRLKDALSLAAAAARTGQRPGVISMTLTWISSFIAFGLQTAWTVLTYPWHMVTSTVEGIKSWFSIAERQSRKRVKGKGDERIAIPNPKIHSRSAR